jgi:hypothetical protein
MAGAVTITLRVRFRWFFWPFAWTAYAVRLLTGASPERLAAWVVRTCVVIELDGHG